MTLLLVLGALVGIVLGLTGAGAGILAVPALVFGMGWTMQEAAPVALIAVAAGAALGAFTGWKQGLVRYRGAMLMATVGVLFAPLGVRAAQTLPQRWLIMLFALAMLPVAYRLLRRGRESPPNNARISAYTNPVTGRFHWNWPTACLLGLVGAITGFIAGLLGVGGGIVMVPVLSRFTDVSMQGIVATSLLVTAIVATAGALAGFAHGIRAPLQESLMFTAATMFGMLLSRVLAKHMREHHVQFVFAAILIFVAGGLLFKAICLPDAAGI
jgi:uncharacterized membrane protein YfcA